MHFTDREPRIGKTTMIKQLINAIGPDLCGGFYTEEITNSSGRIGFKCVSVCGESVEIAHVETQRLVLEDTEWM